MSQWTGRVGRVLHFLAIAGIPFVVACVAVVLYPLWVLGIPGTPDAPYAQGWFIGYMALSLYLPAYFVGVIVLITARLLKWPLAAFIHGLIWLCTLALLVAMAISVSRLS